MLCGRSRRKCSMPKRMRVGLVELPVVHEVRERGGRRVVQRDVAEVGLVALAGLVVPPHAGRVDAEVGRVERLLEREAGRAGRRSRTRSRSGPCTSGSAPSRPRRATRSSSGSRRCPRRSGRPRSPTGCPASTGVSGSSRGDDRREHLVVQARRRACGDRAPYERPCQREPLVLVVAAPQRQRRVVADAPDRGRAPRRRRPRRTRRPPGTARRRTGSPATRAGRARRRCRRSRSTRRAPPPQMRSMFMPHSTRHRQLGRGAARRVDAGRERVVGDPVGALGVRSARR